MQDYRKLPESEKKTFWENHITSWHNSTMSQKEYCHTHNLKLSTFGYWINRLKKEKSKETGLVPISFITQKISHGIGSPLELIINESITLSIPIGFDPEHLSRVLHVLGVSL